VTFLFSDIEGSTQRWARDRAAMQGALRLHDRLMREALAAKGGHVFKTMGDAFCAAFATPEAAAAAINTGTADERDGDYFDLPSTASRACWCSATAGRSCSRGWPPIWCARTRLRRRR
jgi:class 3 adenylate cyclase